MRKWLSVFIIVTLGVLSGIRVYSAEETERRACDYKIKGYSIAYGENNQAVFQNYGDGIDEDSVFELASNGKMVSAYIAMQLVNEGKLDLEDKMASLVDTELLTDDKRMYDITVRQLLCHTAGFSPSYELGIDSRIYTEPGEEFCYSGVGYIYLQNVIEHVSGMSMEEAARYYVFEPLQMDDSTFAYAKTVTPYMNLSSIVVYMLAFFIMAFVVLVFSGFVIGRIMKCRWFSSQKILAGCFLMACVMNTLFLLFVFVSKVVAAFWIYAACTGFLLLLTRKKTKMYYAVIPIVTMVVLALGLTVPVSLPVTNDLAAKEPNCAYTLKSTSEDMSRFCRELLRQYNEDGAIKEMFSEAVRIDEANSWGLGIAIETGSEGATYWHSGINPGFQSLVVLYPLKNTYIIVLTNSDSGLDFSKEIANSYLDTERLWDIKR